MLFRSTIGTSDRRLISVTGFKDGLYRVYLHQDRFKKGAQLEIVAIAVNAIGEKLVSNLQSVKLP